MLRLPEAHNSRMCFGLEGKTTLFKVHSFETRDLVVLGDEAGDGRMQFWVVSYVLAHDALL